MRAFLQQQDQSRKQASCPILRLQRPPGHQAHPTGAGSNSQESTRFGHDFSQMPVFHWSEASPGNRQSPRFFDDKPKKQGGKNPEPQTPPSREPCDTKCGTGGGPYGSTECEIDLKTGLPNGKVAKEVYDKNPCTRPCVEVHEDVHAKKLKPLCAATKRCLDAAGGDSRKQDKCLDKFEAGANAMTFSTECAAYTAEEKCLSKRAGKAACKSADGKKRWDEQMKMVKCYKGCFCKG